MNWFEIIFLLFAIGAFIVALLLQLRHLRIIRKVSEDIKRIQLTHVISMLL